MCWITTVTLYSRKNSTYRCHRIDWYLWLESIDCSSTTATLWARKTWSVRCMCSHAGVYCACLYVWMHNCLDVWMQVYRFWFMCSCDALQSDYHQIHEITIKSMKLPSNPCNYHQIHAISMHWRWVRCDDHATAIKPPCTLHPITCWDSRVEYVYTFMWFVCICTWVCLCLSLTDCLCVSLTDCLSICLSLCLSVRVPVSPSVCVAVGCAYVCLWVSLPCQGLKV